MREQLEKRLQELKVEFERGQENLQELETQTNKIRNTLLRISGAIQVLEEELASAAQSTPENPADSHGALLNEAGGVSQHR